MSLGNAVEVYLLLSPDRMGVLVLWVPEASSAPAPTSSCFSKPLSWTLSET